MDQYQWDPNSEISNPYTPNEKKPKKKPTGFLAVLIVLALLASAVSWAVYLLDIRLEVGDNSVSVSVGKDAALEQTAPSQPELPQEAQPREPASMSPRDDQTALQVEVSPQSVEHIPAAQEGALSLQEIYTRVIPSVASISCVMQNGTGTGTGIVMSEEGHIITNYHVVDGARKIYVLLGQDDTYEANLLGGDETTDLAVLKIEAQSLQPARFGDSDALRVGDSVVAIGDPLGTELRGTMTDGIVSAINRDLNLSGRQMTLIQTNAALNNGNSGGPLINCYGQVVGINTMKMSNYSRTTSTVEGLGFAIPISAAKPIIDELIQQGYVSGRPAIGIRGQTLDLRTQFFYHLPSGVIVTDILEESNAASIGLDVDDVIVGLNDTQIDSLEDLVAAKKGLSAGETVTLTVYRSGRYYYVQVELIDQISPDIY